MYAAALDFETANEKRHSACALGVTLIDGMQVQRTQYWLMRPSGAFNWMNTQVHGLTASDVRGKPGFAELWTQEIEPLLRGRLLIAHNAAFDMSVLRKCLEYYQLEKPQMNYICTFRMAKKIWPHFSSHKLNVLAQAFNIELWHHNAASDAAACAVLALKCAEARECKSFEDLAKSDRLFRKKL